MPAFNKFSQDVRNWWPRPSSLVWCPREKEPKLAWKLIFADTSDYAGALGYHDFTPDGRPISYVFAADDVKYGYSPTVTATHEIAEMIADPWISQLFQVSNTEFFAQEICDPCEADELGYDIVVPPYDPVLCSDFVLPRYFVPGSEGYRLDWCKQIGTPLDILPGGYMSVFISGKGWTQIYADRVSEEVVVQKKTGKDKYGRLSKYGRDRGDFRVLNVDN